MSLVQQHHTKPTLTYTATNAERQTSVEQLAMEEQLLAVFLAFKLQLSQQGLLVNTNTH